MVTNYCTAGPRRTRILPAPARLPAEPLHVLRDRDAVLDLAQAVADLVQELAVRTVERDEARAHFARSRALHADDVSSRTLSSRQRAETVVLVQHATIVVAAQPRSQSLLFDTSDTIIVDELPTPGHAQTTRLPTMRAYAADGGGR